MTRITCILSRVFLMTIAIGSFAATSQAGYVYLGLIVDPPTTAGAGIPTIARANSTGTFSVTSNKSGAGSWHLYALDTGGDSFGISYFSIQLNGTLSNVFNRSPIASFDTLDDEGNGTGGSGNAGFSLRSSAAVSPRIPPFRSREPRKSARRIGSAVSAIRPAILTTLRICQQFHLVARALGPRSPAVSGANMRICRHTLWAYRAAESFSYWVKVTTPVTSRRLISVPQVRCSTTHRPTLIRKIRLSWFRSAIPNRQASCY